MDGPPPGRPRWSTPRDCVAWWSGPWRRPGSVHPIRPGRGSPHRHRSTSTGSWDEATAEASPGDRADRVRAFVDAAGGLESAGYCRTTYRSGAFVNTAGQAVSGRSADAALDGIARAGGADGVARLASARLADLDGGVLGARAAVKARSGVTPVDLPPGRYEVVLEPAAVADLLQNFAWYGFNGKSYNEHQSFAEPGAEQFDRAITLIDDPTGAPTLPFDAEGTPRHRTPLVERGMTRAVVHDRRTAAEAGTVSTGHALPGGAAAGAIPVNLGLAPAGSPNGPARPTRCPAPSWTRTPPRWWPGWPAGYW